MNGSLASFLTNPGGPPGKKRRQWDPELTEREVMATELPLPVPIRIDLIDENCPLLTAVAGQIAPAVAVDVQPPYQTAARHRGLIRQVAWLAWSNNHRTSDCSAAHQALDLVSHHS